MFFFFWGGWVAGTFDATQFKPLIPAACATALSPPHRGEQEQRIIPATVKYCLTPSHYSKAPPLIILFSALHSSPPGPLAARLRFTLHTRTNTACVDAASWQPLCCIHTVAYHPCEENNSSNNEVHRISIVGKTPFGVLIQFTFFIFS